MDRTIERRWLAVAVFGFAAIYALPLGALAWLDWRPVAFAVCEGAALLQWYAREHVILCLLPAFLYTGPAIDVIAIVITAKVLGVQLGIARAVAAILFAVVIGLALVALRLGDDAQDWMAETWGFAKQIMPLLLAGVFVAGMLLGRPGEDGLIPPGWIAIAVGGEGVGANLFASVVGSLMYFATSTEVPIVQALRGAGMGEGPSLALLLAGPALVANGTILVAGKAPAAEEIAALLPRG